MSTQPSNINYLSPIGFRLILKRTPHIEYFCKAATLPTLTMTEIKVPTPLGAAYFEPSSKLEFEALQVRFQVDEDMKNYLEIQAWMFGLTAPERSEQYTNYVAHNNFQRNRADVFSDGMIQVLTSHKNVNITYKFKDMFPTSLSPLEFDVTNTEVEYLEATLTLRYVSYETTVV